MTNEELYFGKPLITFTQDELFITPSLSMQTASLTPLEKSQIALLIMALKPQVVVETGVWRGLTTKFISEFLTINKIDGSIVSFDLPEVIDQLLSEVEFFKNEGNITFVKGLLPDSLFNWLADNKPIIDLAIIDADHNYFSTYSELEAIAPFMAKDGYIFCHDYGIDQSNHEGVLLAVENFCRKYDFTMLPLQSRPSSPKTKNSAQSVILHRRMTISLSKKISHMRKYLRRKFFTKRDQIKVYKLS